MKTTFALLTIVLSFSSFAQVRVELDAKELTINSASAVVIRTHKTPENVKINFLVPMENSVCKRFETRHVLRTSSVHCGNDTSIHRVSTGLVCTRVHRREVCTETFEDQIVQHPRTCMVPETNCAEYGTEVTTVMDSMKIRFKGLQSLGGPEAETFSIVARQKSYNGNNVVYEVKALETLRAYKVTQKKLLGLFARDSFEVSEK